MTISRIIPADSKDEAWQLSRQLWVEWSERNGTPSGTEQILLAIHENILSGECGLFASPKWWEEISKNHQTRHQIATPLWVNEKFINGDPCLALGGFGFGIMNPAENRKVLEGNFSKGLLDDVRLISRAYNAEVYSRASKIIGEINDNPHNKKKLLEALDGAVFEEVVAELLKAYGCDVILTRRSGDGGKDLIAVLPDGKDPLVMMVECKRRKEAHTLGPLEPRALLGQFYFNNQIGIGYDCAMLVTNASHAGPTALSFDQKISNFTMKMGDDVLTWISNYGRIKDGLWVPNPIDELLR